jgi:hypothetical protein
MAASSYPGSERAARTDSGTYDGGINGWMLFAGVMLMIVGILNFVYGIAAVDSASFYIDDARYVFSDLNTWGWIILIIGALQITGGASLLAGGEWGRWIGILTAGANAIAQLLFLPSFPLLSLALFSIDILILYGLIARWEPRHKATA